MGLLIRDYGSIASKPRLSAAMVVAPFGTGTARNVEAAKSRRKAVRPLASKAVTKGLAPQLTSHPPPGSGRAEPQQWLVVIPGSFNCPR